MQVITITLWNCEITLFLRSICACATYCVHETAAAAHRECLRRVSWLQNRRPWEGCVARAHGLRGPRGHADSSNTNRRVTEHAEPNPAAECARAAGAAVVACGSEECGEKKEAGQEGALSGGARRRRHR